MNWAPNGGMYTARRTSARRATATNYNIAKRESGWSAGGPEPISGMASNVRPFNRRPAFFLRSTPLLEKERHTGAVTLIANVPNPRGIHLTGTGTRLSAHDRPINAPKIK